MLLTWVVDCIGNVSRVYPAEGRERLREIFEPIKNILTEDKETNLLTADLEESCLRALIWTGHHLQVIVLLLMFIHLTFNLTVAKGT